MRVAFRQACPLSMASATGSAAAETTTFDNLQADAIGSEYGFQEPPFSSVTAGETAATSDIARAAETLPAGLGSGHARENLLAFIDASLNRCVRHSTFSAAGGLNSLLDLPSRLQCEIHPMVPVRRNGATSDRSRA